MGFILEIREARYLTIVRAEVGRHQQVLIHKQIIILKVTLETHIVSVQFKVLYHQVKPKVMLFPNIIMVLSQVVGVQIHSHNMKIESFQWLILVVKEILNLSY